LNYIYVVLYFTFLLEHNFLILGLMIIFLALKLVPSYYTINIQISWSRFCSLRLVICTQRDVLFQAETIAKAKRTGYRLEAVGVGN